jgi:glycosyltransferase involved in cell wall biosynthesis
MRLLIITALYPPAVGGAAAYFGDIVPRLAHHNDVETVVVLTERLPQHQRRHQVTERLHLLRDLPARVSVPRTHWPRHAMTYILTQAWFVLRLPALVRRYQIDLIHFHTRYRGRGFEMALRQCHIPSLADLHDKLTTLDSLPQVIDRLLCCGEGVQQYARAAGFPPERTTLLPLAFTPPARPTATQVLDVCRQYALHHTPFMLFVGDMTTNKGVDELLEAYRGWRIAHPDVRLVLVGPNRQGKRFLQHVAQTPGAVYLGSVPHADALALMCGADIVVLPSRSEGLPRVILEAIALERKVICPPGIPEFARYLPQCVLPDVSVPAIQDALERVWWYQNVPPYPFAAHSAQRVVEQLIEVYRTTSEQT